MRAMWPTYMQLQVQLDIDPMLHLALYQTAQHATAYSLSFLLCYVMYTQKFEICERYRAYKLSGESEQWPWESMSKQEWQAFFRRSLLFNLMNMFVWGPSIPVVVYFATKFGL
jgi:hypothetical protein